MIFTKNENGEAITPLLVNGKEVATLMARAVKMELGDSSERVPMRDNDIPVVVRCGLFVIADDGTATEYYQHRSIQLHGTASEIGTTDIASDVMKNWVVDKLVEI